jgi:hypothetical protein
MMTSNTDQANAAEWGLMMADLPMTEAELPKFLAMKLAQFALSQRGCGLPDHKIAGAFLSVGVQMAIYAYGDVGAAEWLRDVADEIEHGDQTAPTKGQRH